MSLLSVPHSSAKTTTTTTTTATDPIAMQEQNRAIMEFWRRKRQAPQSPPPRLGDLTDLTLLRVFSFVLDLIQPFDSSIANKQSLVANTKSRKLKSASGNRCHSFALVCKRWRFLLLDYNDWVNRTIFLHSSSPSTPTTTMATTPTTPTVKRLSFFDVEPRFQHVPIVEPSFLTASLAQPDSFVGHALRQSMLSIVRFSTLDFDGAFTCWNAVLPDSSSSSGSISLQNAIHAIQRAMVLLCHGGYFVGAYFESGKPIVHKTLARYVVRKKGGFRQSGHDRSKFSSNGGSYLRRHHEEQLRQQIADLIRSWDDLISKSNLIFMFAPGDNKKILCFDEEVLSADDPRLRSIPFPTERPTFKEAKRVFSVLSSLRSVALLSEPSTEQDSADVDDGDDDGGEQEQTPSSSPDESNSSGQDDE